MTHRTKVGIIGCGGISGTYLRTMRTFPELSLEACADLVAERARGRAEEFGVPRWCSVEELLAIREIDLVVNLTPPKAHHAVTSAILQAGKHAYSEKPLAATFEQGRELVETARSKGLFLGCAPDTFLGAGAQTCRQLLDGGSIGRPVAVCAFQMRSPPEAESGFVPFAYEAGGGPLFDMGPYYFTALVALLGPIRSVAAFSQISWPDRIASLPPRAGLRLAVEMPTYATGVIAFRGGELGTLITTYDVWASMLPNLEVYGDTGTLQVPDPNCFGGPVRVRTKGGSEWRDIPLSRPYREDSRGLGVADLVHALRHGRAPRASADLAFHVLEAMHGFLESSRTGRAYELASTCERPSPLAPDLAEGTVR
jgi:predicted dehydrogenase